LAGETEVLRENLPQCHFVHHIQYVTFPFIPVFSQGQRTYLSATGKLQNLVLCAITLIQFIYCSGSSFLGLFYKEVFNSRLTAVKIMASEA
jgi:hypothetical protein